MPIQVTCPKCLKRFQVSDKFAGKSGPCPNCKNPIKIPEESEAVVIHAPDDGAPKDRSGQSVLKPIKRKETDVTRTGLLITAGCILAAFGMAFGFRLTSGESGTPLWAQIFGLVALAPPLVWAGYKFVHDPELEPYRGTELRDRVLICSGIFVAIWSVYAFVPTYLMDLDRPSEMSYMTAGIFFCIMLGLGALASSATFELEFISGLTHAGLYMLSVLLLAVVSGVSLAGVTPAAP
jgi:cation transport ATPase